MTTTYIVRTPIDVTNLQRDKPDMPNLDYLYEAMVDVASLRRDAADLADSLVARLQSARSRFVHGTLNPLGELQHSATQFDILCARFEDAKRHAAVVAKMCGVEVGF